MSSSCLAAQSETGCCLWHLGGRGRVSVQGLLGATKEISTSGYLGLAKYVVIVAAGLGACLRDTGLSKFQLTFRVGI